MTEKLLSWGRYPNKPQLGTQVNWQHEVHASLLAIGAENRTTLVYGAGRSYGDVCLSESGHVLTSRGLDRFISADWIKGRIRAEAGVTLAQVLEVAIPNGWFLAVTPGTKFVTLGGAVANDVHGKNHHTRGTFGCHTRAFGLRRTDGCMLTCSSHDNSELFAATIGGLGLTGFITWVEIQLIPIRSSQVNSTSVRFGTLREFFDLSSELDHQHEYSVAWIDCLAKGKQTGRGVFTVGDHSPYGDLELRERRKISVPIAPPFSMINKYSLSVFNEAYWRKGPSRRTVSRVNYDPFFYPLDSVFNWNKVYGASGFQQYQCIIPDLCSYEVILELLEIIASSGQGSFLAVLKRGGNIPSPGLLSFPMAGVSLALDFPQNVLLEGLFNKMDSVVIESGGRLYPAKDAHMRGIDFRKSYPQWNKLELLRDPALMSRFWKRVTT